MASVYVFVCVRMYVCMYVYIYIYIYIYGFFLFVFRSNTQFFSFILLPKNLKIKVKTNCKFTSFLHYVIEFNFVAFRNEYRLIVSGNLGVK